MIQQRIAANISKTVNTTQQDERFRGENKT